MAASMFRHSSGGWIVAAAAAAAAAAVFALDILTPLGYPVPILYVLPILLTWLVRGRLNTALVAGIMVGLTWVAVLLSPSGLPFIPIPMTNRTMISVVLLVVAGLLMKQKQLSQQAADAHEARRVSESQLRLFIQHAPAAIAMFDARMCYVAASRRWMTGYGLAEQDLRGRSLYDLFPEIEERWKQVHRRCLAGAVERSDEDLLVRADGSRQWLRWEVHPWRTASDAVGGIIIFTEDISEHKRAEEALSKLNTTLDQRVKERSAELVQANERFEWVSVATHDGVWDWDFIHDRMYFSPRWKAMHGFERTEITESPEEWSSRIHSDDRDSVLGRLQDYLAGKRPEFWEEYRIRRKDGTWMWVLDRGVALWDEQGRAARMVGAETDITWRKEAEEALRRREQEFHILADSVPAIFIYIDRDRRYRFVNRRYVELFNRPSDEIVGSTMSERLGPEGYAAVQPHLDAAFGGQDVSFEYSLPVPGAGECWFSARYVPDRDEEGNVAGLFILLADVTSLKSIEADLREKEQQLRDLSARLLQIQEEERRRISQELHDDFTQRLAALTIDLRMVRLEPPGSDSLSVSRLRQMGDSLEQMTTDLQQMAHRLHPSILEHVGLEAAVREQAEEFAARTGISTEAMVRELPNTIPLEQALCLYRVLQESLQNVRKHAGATNVLVRLLKISHGVGLCVHDDGQGFDQAQRVTNRHSIGLRSMEERVQQIKGTFRIRAKPGHGTEVHAWVPLENMERKA